MGAAGPVLVLLIERGPDLAIISTPTSRGLPTNREYWQKMEELYHAALEKSGEAREALLADSDPEVRRGVEVLLAQGTSGDKVLDRPAWEQTDTPLEAPPASQIAPGDQLGPYRIQARVGAGGMAKCIGQEIRA